MTDLIEKIVSKWGFERHDDGDTPQFERIYRFFYFSIRIDFARDFIEIYARSKAEDKQVCSYQRTEFLRDFRNPDIWITKEEYDYWKLEFVIKDAIQEFMDNFFKYDLFHDKEWKDGK